MLCVFLLLAFLPKSNISNNRNWKGCLCKFWGSVYGSKWGWYLARLLGLNFTCLVSRVFEWFYISAKSFLTLSLGVCIKKKIQPIRIWKLQTIISVNLGNHKMSVITRTTWHSSWIGQTSSKEPFICVFYWDTDISYRSYVETCVKSPS